MRILRYLIFVIFVSGFIIPMDTIQAAEELETVTIQFKWFHQFQFAGYYAALEKGFYAEEGLNVVLRERDPKTDHIEDVIEGKAQYGVADAGLLLSRLQGKPVVLLSQIFQHSPLVFLTLQKSGIRTPFDLAGKTIMLDSNVYKYPALSALILKTLGGSDKVTQIQETFRNEDLLEGKTDAMVAYLSDQPFWFKEKGIPVNVIDPRDYGIDFYGDNFFTTEKEIYKNPDRIKKIIRASLKGWDYALTHQQEMIDLIHLKYNPQKLSRKHLIHESKETEKMIVPRFVKLGHFEPSRFQKIIETYVQLGLTDQAMIDEGFFYQDGKKSAINRKIKPSFHLTQEERAWLKSHPVIRVSSELDYAPFDFVENNKSVGFSIDYLNLIAGKVGLQLTFVQDTWKNLIKMGKEKEIDLLHSIFYTPERDAFFSFTEPYKTVVNAIYVKTGITGITSISDLANRRVALSKSGSIAKLLPQLVPDAEFIFVDNYEETLKATSLGKADATILDTAVGNYLIRQNTLTNIIPVAEADIPTTGTDPRYRLAVHKDASELHSILQKAMNTVTRDEMAEIELRWFSLPTAFDGATDDGIKNLTPEEQTWLKAHPVIRVHNEKDWPPFNYNEYDSPRGLSIDYMNLLAKKLGVTVEYVNGPSWNEFLGMIKEKKLDVMLNIVKTEERQKYILYTPPFMRTPVGIASLDNKPYDNIENLFGKTVAFPKGFVYEEILTKKFPQILQLPLKNTLESLKAVSFGKADAALGKAAVMRYLVEKNLLSSLVISGEFQLKNTDLVDLRIGMRDDWPLLQSALTKAMQTVTPEEMKEIQGKWLLTALNEPLVSIKTKPHTRSPQLTQLSFAQMVTYSVIIFLVVCLLAFILLRTLRRENVALNFGSPWFRGLVLIGLSIFVLIVAFLGWINLENNKTTHLKGVDESLKGLLSLSQERLDLWLEERISFMTRLGRDQELTAITKRLLTVEPDKDTLLATKELQDVRSFFNDSDDRFSNSGFFIISPDHVSIGAMRDTNVGTQNLIAKEYPEILKRAFQGKVGFVPPMTSDVYLGDSGQSDTAKKPPTMFFIGPVRDMDGLVIAVMTLRMDPWKDFARAMKPFKSGGETYAFDRNGCMLSASRFDDQLHKIGLLAENQGSALNIQIRDPGGNLVEGYRPTIERSGQPLTHMAASAIAQHRQMERANIRQGYSPMTSSLDGYRDYRGVPVFGAWIWSMDLNIGIAVEIDVDDALNNYNQTRRMIFGILGFTLFLSVGAILFVLIIGERTSRALMQARDDLEQKVTDRTAELTNNQKQLTLAEERSRLLLNSVGEGIFGVDMKGRVMFINAAANGLLGYENDELIGMDVHAKIHHSHADHSPYPAQNCPMSRAYTLGATETISDEMLWRKDSSGFSVEYTATPIMQETEITGAVITFRDITERKRAEETIRASEARLALAAEAGGLGMWEWRVDLDRVIVSDFWLKLKGLTREEYNQSVDQWADGLHPDDKDQAVDLLNRHLEGESDHFEVEYRFQHPQRGWYWEHASARVIERDADGKPLRMVGYHQDISERKNMEQALSDERERLQQILDVSPVGVGISSEGVLQFVNPRMTKLFGLNIGDPAPQFYLDIEDRNNIISELRKKKIVQGYEMQVYGKKREILDIMASYMLTDLDGKEAILGWWIDITELKQTDRELREKLDQLARFRRLAVGRETKMIDLKQEINELSIKCGMAEKYKIRKEVGNEE